MTTSPPLSPSGPAKRPASMMLNSRPSRSSSRMSMSKGSRASDEDTKTSVKVAVRVRPPLGPSDPGYELIPQRFQRSMVQVTSPTNLAVDSPQGRKLFVFDRIFGEDVTQEGLWEYLCESVRAFVQGYNVSVLAYGQSGSGKSYTMGTSATEQTDPHVMGVVPRAAYALFDVLEGNAQHNRNGSNGPGTLRTPTRYSTSSSSAIPSLKSHDKGSSDKTWEMKATYVEIYNEQLRDLLLPETVPQGERNSVTIREDPRGRILLTGLHQITINSVSDLLDALNFGSSIRQTDATNINAKSSRSHAVFSLNLVQRKTKSSTMSPHEKRMSVPIEAMSGTEGWVTVDSKLHFVDLAGSERLKNTGAVGERAREGISINAGLASLGKVISQLSSRNSGSHVSYRDSKLTRLLQDSLGGNAITYMIACVTPAEFHLSETLNTVQYAQRARAIQSKPRIQQVNDDSDKQAVIDRLKAEIAFLRDQIRNSERNDRRTNAPQERAERQNEREIELQNHLLDIQESYTALSQRHAKLISEISKAQQDHSEETPTLNDAIGDNAVERLKRSNSFAEAVEKVVLEYEKTIQTLESSLSNTRSSLATTESSLLERESKCAYIETVNTQLQTRVQKLMDRESSTENYLHDLEAKLDGHTSGEEKNAAIITELRKEIARARENEASCEDYISTLEERLAESDQDMELMQREVERLEHVVERQRSLGKLDNLLYELDHLPQNGKPSTEEDASNGVSSSEQKPIRSRSKSRDRLAEAAGIAIPGLDDDLGDHPPMPSPIREETEVTEDAQVQTENDSLQTLESQSLKHVVESQEQAVDQYPQSPAQSRFVQDKLESVTQELFDLRVEHEGAVTEYDLLSAKYEEALRTLAELQDVVDEARHPAALPNVASPASTRPQSFLAVARVEEPKEEGHLSSSRSLLSELSLAGESPNITESSDIEIETPVKESDSAGVDRVMQKEGVLVQEMEVLKKLQTEKESGMAALTEQYAHLQEQHREALDMVEELKIEVQKARMMAPPTTPTTPVIRRKSSQNVMTIDRAHRSLASLRNIAAEEFEHKPEVIQNFELNLSTAMHELHSRSERIEALEVEITAVKKEMETKTTIISGLTRERSSLHGQSPVDLSMVSSMRDQLLQSENEIRVLREQSAGREKELLDKIEALRESLAVHETPSLLPVPGYFPKTPAEDISESGSAIDVEKEKRLAELQEELTEWQDRHKSAYDSLQETQDKLNETLAELEKANVNMEVMRTEREDSVGNEDAEEKAALAAELESERRKHQETVEALQKEIADQATSLNSRENRVAELEASYASAREELEKGLKSHDTDQTEIAAQSELVSALEKQLEEHKSITETYKQELQSLQDSHTRELEDLKLSTAAAAEADLQARLAEEATKHQEALNSLQVELDNSKQEIEAAKQEMVQLLDEASRILQEPTAVGKLQGQIHNLILEKSQALSEVSSAIEFREAAENKLAIANAAIEELNDTKSTLECRIKEIEEKAGESEKSAIELKELEESNDQLKSRNQELEDVVKDQVKTIDVMSKKIEQITTKEQKLSRLVDELEEQIANSFDQHQAVTNRQSLLQAERTHQLEEANSAKAYLEKDLEEARQRIGELEIQLTSADGDRPTSPLRKSTSVANLPSPPPAIPLPPLPNIANNANSTSPPNSRHVSRDMANAQLTEDQEARIKTMEKHLHAEKQLTATLEEALVDLETQSNKLKADIESWKKKAWTYEDELQILRKERNSQRLSVQQMETERNARREAEAARAHLEEKMNALNKKKKKGTLNCF